MNDLLSEYNLLLTSAKKISLEAYLQSRGLFPVKTTGNRLWYFSPFNEEKTPSFVLYTTSNTFVDYSSGIKGDIVDFICEYDKLSFTDALDSVFKGKLLPIQNKIKKKPKDNSIFKNFNWSSFVTHNIEEIELINKYALSRGITEKYQPCFLHANENDSLVKKLAMGFIHKDEDLDICGIKFRFIEGIHQRFSSRGRLCYYYLNGGDEYIDERLFITESETSSNSLHMILKQNALFKYHILCVGGSTNYPTKIPEVLNHIENKYVIIDFDGGKQYNEKIKIFSNFGKPIDLKYEKGIDINYLYLNQRENEIITELSKYGMVFV
jgi:hypothetical protein